MRARLAALAALAPLVPSVAEAQLSFTPLPQQYAISGCVDGPLRYDNVGGFPVPVRGRVACFAGTSQFEVARPGGSADVLLRMVGRMTATFNPEFTAPFIGADPAANGISFAYNNPGAGGAFCVAGVCVGTLRISVGDRPDFLTGGDAVATFTTADELLPATADLSSIRDVSGRVGYVWQPAGAPPGGGDGGPAALTFTPIPEPSTLVLAAAGGLALLGVSRRRTQA